MKKIICILFIAAFFICLTEASFAAPMEWGIAINKSAKECAGYWGGDEFTQNKLPWGWKAYYGQGKQGITLETPYGACNFYGFNDYDWGNPAYTDFDTGRQCCNNLGLKFVYREVFNRSSYSAQDDNEITQGPYDAILINSQVSQCSVLSHYEKFGYQYCPIGDICHTINKINFPEGWEVFNFSDYNFSKGPYDIIETEIGKCNFFRSDPGACCTQLGYTYVSDNIGEGKKYNIRDDKKGDSNIFLYTGISLISLLAVLFFAVVCLVKRKKRPGI